jgi:uncharacterized repeat protein (TIGR03803 family)
MTVRLIRRIPRRAAALVVLVSLTGTCRAGGLVPIASFNGTNGLSPTSSVTLANGNIYGTANGGGPSGKGTVWEIGTGTNTITTLASFQGTNGSTPVGGLAVDSQGNFYGVTVSGGAKNLGTVWELANGSNTITTLASFNASTGANPVGNVAVDSQGNVYGTTSIGGSSNEGTVWEIVKGSNAITTRASFTSTTGAVPHGGVTIDAQGDLFGTTYNGGSNNAGTVWELVKGSSTITTLASFNAATGTLPQSEVTLANGNIYGTAFADGAGGQGTVWELAKGSSTITVLGSFNGANGGNPYGAVSVDARGDVFGTAAYSGEFALGTAWEVVAGSGTITALASFDGANGGLPQGGVTLNAQGDLFGTAQVGGANGNGTVWEFTGAASVPEPSSIILALIGAASTGVVAAMRRPRRLSIVPFGSPTVR